MASCATYREHLNLSQRHFEANDFERALVLLRDLERDLDALSPPERARYAYLRGMADYRMSYRSDARHWLALAREFEAQTPGAFSEPWKARIVDAQRDLDREVFGNIASSVTTLASPIPSPSVDSGPPGR